MKKIALLVITYIFSITHSASGGEAEFVKFCSDIEILPEDQKITVRSLISIGSNGFREDKPSCQKIFSKLNASTHLRAVGATFEYIKIGDVAPIATLENLRSIDFENQVHMTDLTPLASLKLTKLNIAGTGVRNLDQLKIFNLLESVTVTINGHFEIAQLAQLSGITELALRVPQQMDLYLSTLESIPYLRSLDIEGSHSSSILGLQQLRNLEVLSISSGTVDARDISFLPLKVLLLGTQQTVHIQNSAQIGVIRTLEKLSLPNQGLTDTKSFRNLVLMRHLDLSSNEISNIEGLKEMTQLSSLNLSYNDVWDARIIRDLTNLEVLELSRNRISAYFVADSLTKLKHLDLSSNNLHAISFGVHPQLETVLLSKNELRGQIGSTFVPEKLPVLKNLDLASNNLSILKGLGSLTSLNYLSIDDNKIKTTADLKGLSNLKRLSARYNIIAKEDQFCPVINTKNPVCDFLHQEVLE